MAEVLVTHPIGRLDAYYGEKALAALRAQASVRLNPHDRELSFEELVALARGCEAIVAYRDTPGPAALFDALPGLRAFVRCAVDIRTVDVSAASRHGVLVTRAGPGFVAAVAEWVLGALIDLSRGVTRLAETYHRGGEPVAHMGRELAGSTIGVIGYGQIGRRVCELARAFGMRVVVSDPYATGDAATVVQLGLRELLATSDYVVCLATATEETENLIDAQALAAMKRGAYFVNASRGNLVDEDALLDALNRGHIAGCALDVGRAPDQMPALALARHPLVVATPHIGGLTRPATEFQAMQTVKQVADLLSGRVPEGAVNAEHASRCGFAMPSRRD